MTLLLSRGHYSIDVLIAYWITTRMWWMYHTLCNHEVLKSPENSDNYLNRIWWWYIFNYFEGNELLIFLSIILWTSIWQKFAFGLFSKDAKLNFEQLKFQSLWYTWSWSWEFSKFENFYIWVSVWFMNFVIFRQSASKATSRIRMANSRKTTSMEFL